MARGSTGPYVPRVLLPGFQHRPGVHCGSTALADALRVRGLDCLDGTPLIDLKPDRCLFTPLAPEQPVSLDDLAPAEDAAA